jgi:GNAT superfamily N-acetyltransferase
MSIQPLREQDFPAFVALLNALADYEKLPRPDDDARQRLFSDALGERPRFSAALAWDGDRAVGYAIWFETYSSFLARPTMHLEDLFVLEECRGQGIGTSLFSFVEELGRNSGCGRMEWQVLDWNTTAQDFYRKHEATPMNEWMLFRKLL